MKNPIDHAYKLVRKGLILILLLAFIFSGMPPFSAQAQSALMDGGELSLPAPGAMVHLSPEFDPPVLRGIKVHVDNPFRFDFILDQGENELSNDQLKDESTRLIKYFLAGLTIPEKDLWVNLSPYEKDRIIPKSFGLTQMGRDLLAEDYMLKQITASLIYPEDKIGKKFWKRVYEEAFKKYGTNNIPVNTFNKVWIVPEKAVVYENAKTGTAYVVESKLKVMLEQDYLAMQKDKGNANPGLSVGPFKGTSALGSDIVREIVIPELAKEVNEDKNFAQLRQVYNSLILATWYKKKIKDSILSRVYDDKNKTKGVGFTSNSNVGTIYQRYLQAFRKGVYNFIKEEQDPVTNQPIPRKYFSGGFTAMRLRGIMSLASAAMITQASLPTKDHAKLVTAEINPENNTTTVTAPEPYGTKPFDQELSDTTVQQDLIDIWSRLESGALGKEEAIALPEGPRRISLRQDKGSADGRKYSVYNNGQSVGSVELSSYTDLQKGHVTKIDYLRLNDSGHSLPALFAEFYHITSQGAVVEFRNVIALAFLRSLTVQILNQLGTNTPLAAHLKQKNIDLDKVRQDLRLIQKQGELSVERRGQLEDTLRNFIYAFSDMPAQQTGVTLEQMVDRSNAGILLKKAGFNDITAHFSPARELRMGDWEIIPQISIFALKPRIAASPAQVPHHYDHAMVHTGGMTRPYVDASISYSDVTTHFPFQNLPKRTVDQVEFRSKEFILNSIKFKYDGTGQVHGLTLFRNKNGPIPDFSVRLPVFRLDFKNGVPYFWLKDGEHYELQSGYALTEVGESGHEARQYVTVERYEEGPQVFESVDHDNIVKAVLYLTDVKGIEANRIAIKNRDLHHDNYGLEGVPLNEGNWTRFLKKLNLVGWISWEYPHWYTPTYLDFFNDSRDHIVDFHTNDTRIMPKDMQVLSSIDFDYFVSTNLPQERIVPRSEILKEINIMVDSDMQNLELQKSSVGLFINRSDGSARTTRTYSEPALSQFIWNSLVNSYSRIYGPAVLTMRPYEQRFDYDVKPVGNERFEAGNAAMSSGRIGKIGAGQVNPVWKSEKAGDKKESPSQNPQLSKEKDNPTAASGADTVEISNEARIVNALQSLAEGDLGKINKNFEDKNLKFTKIEGATFEEADYQQVFYIDQSRQIQIKSSSQIRREGLREGQYYQVLAANTKLNSDVQLLVGSIVYIDPAMNTGGIDLTAAYMKLQDQYNNIPIKFHLDPAMLALLQEAPGFTPEVIKIQPMNNIRQFLGLADDQPDPKGASL